MHHMHYHLPGIAATTVVATVFAIALLRSVFGSTAPSTVHTHITVETKEKP